MTQISAFKTPEGEAAYLAAYDTAMALWPVSYEELEIPGRFGTTHVVVSGPKDAPPLVLLHGYMANLIMWSPNVGDFSKEYRVYAIDTMGQPGRSIPDPEKPIRDAADFVAWLNETLSGLNLDSVIMVGMSFGGWLALNFTLAMLERVQKLVLLSPVASFQPLVRQMGLRGMLMFIVPSRLTVNSCFRWMGFKRTPGDALTRYITDMAYLGVKHFRFSPETARILPCVFSDEELRKLRVPVQLLIGEDDVIYDPAKALARARTLLPDFRGELVPQSNHEMCASQHQIVDSRVLDFLNNN